ncbi:hypothetical protein, partial [Pseudochrobactrum sp. AO18b]|uniref:hypothetical protein n=1 Tax=Pseudochrobactrum sp. AO18b TaxID=1201036 RepID=UPI001AEC061C
NNKRYLYVWSLSPRFIMRGILQSAAICYILQHTYPLPCFKTANDNQQADQDESVCIAFTCPARHVSQGELYGFFTLDRPDRCNRISPRLNLQQAYDGKGKATGSKHYPACNSSDAQKQRA